MFIYGLWLNIVQITAQGIGIGDPRFDRIRCDIAAR
jgi:hypothetical protein